MTAGTVRLAIMAKLRVTPTRGVVASGALAGEVVGRRVGAMTTRAIGLALM
jgi:hypothetical protein